MGQLALTFYVAHVIFGIGLLEVIYPEQMGNYPLEFSIIYAFVFSLMCLGFAYYWMKNKKNGPVEWVMKRIIG
jgi:uncharacterized membrane protein YeiB